MSRIWSDIRNLAAPALLLLRYFLLLLGCWLGLNGLAIAQDTPGSNEPLQALARQLGSQPSNRKPQSPRGTIPRVGDLPQVKASDHPGILSGGDPGEVLQEFVDYVRDVPTGGHIDRSKRYCQRKIG